MTDQSLPALRNCPFCGSGASAAAYPFRSRFAGQVFTYHACGGCRLVFINPVPSEQMLAAMYGSGDYHDEFYAGDGQGAYAATAARLAALLPAGARVLDFGCGAGHLLAALRARGLDASGVEFSAPAARQAAQRSGCAVFEISSADWQAAGQWDCIHFGDVIEHLANPRGVLVQCTGAIRPGGLLSAEGPLEANPSLVHAAARLVDAAKRLARPGAVKEFPPYHLIFAAADSQRAFLDALPGLDRVSFTLAETGWPYRRNGPVRNAIALAAIAASALPVVGQRLGNRFATIYRKAADQA